MLKYIDEKIKLEYIKWVTFIYDGNFNESIFSNEELFKVFVEEKINEDVNRHFYQRGYKIKLKKIIENEVIHYYFTLYLNSHQRQFDINNSFSYKLDSKSSFDTMYYNSVDTIDLPF